MLILFAAFALAALGTSAAAQPPPSTIAPPTATDLARRFVAAFNTGGSMHDFIAANFASTALSRESADSRAGALDRLKAQAGGLEIITVQSQGERMAEMMVRTRQGGKTGRLVLFASGREPGRISNLFLIGARDPVRAGRDAFPAGKVGEAQIARLVRSRIESLAEEDLFSGAVLVARNDRVLLRQAVGLADQSWAVTNRADTRFHVASVGKMWTAVTLLRLAEQGKLSLDDPLSRWVPDYPHREAAEKISLRMLLQHRGGLPDWDGRRLGQVRPAQAAAAMTDPPGPANAAFAYSNAGYVLLAAAAEAASGKAFEALIEEHVFGPAGMTRSGLWPVTAIVADRATGYLRPGDDPFGFGPRYSNHQYLGFGADGSGGGYSTVDDMFAFHRALAGGTLLSSATFSAMTGQSVDFAGSPRPSRYGLGLRLTDCSGQPTLGHSGGGANSGVSSVTYASASGEWTIVVLSNYDPPAAEDLALDICELVHRSA